MDYEKKYKEALANMQELYNSMKYMSSTDALHTTMYLEKAFPEFKESEDEKIRKEIIEYLRFKYEDPNAIRHDYEKWMAWLEKQGEQKRIWSKEDEIGLSDALWAIKQARTIAKDENDMGNLWYAEKWLRTLKERMKGE